MVAAGTIAPGAEITVDYREMLVINGRLDVASQLEKPTEAKIYSAERFLATLPQTEVEPKHVFADGIYSRELLIPAGNWITGKVHKQNSTCSRSAVWLLSPSAERRNRAQSGQRFWPTVLARLSSQRRSGATVRRKQRRDDRAQRLQATRSGLSSRCLDARSDRGRS